MDGVSGFGGNGVGPGVWALQIVHQAQSVAGGGEKVMVEDGCAVHGPSA